MSSHAKGERVDAALFERGLCESREKARALIMAGAVYIGEEKVLKPSQPVAPEAELTVRGKRCPFVSRGGYKLDKALTVFGVDVNGLVALDVGASTGGFTDVLLQRGARRVFSVDVGQGQLDYRLRTDPRVTVMERVNARSITQEMFDERPQLAVMDVSFISIKLILPALYAVLGARGRVVTLVKPQFEAGRERVGKKGVVSDPATHLDVLISAVAAASESGFGAVNVDFSPITGPEGNMEFLLELLPGAERAIDDERLRATVTAAHAEFAR